MFAKVNFSISLALSSVEEEKDFFESKLLLNDFLILLVFQVEEDFTGVMLLSRDLVIIWLDEKVPADSARPVNKSCDQVEAEALLHE